MKTFLLSVIASLLFGVAASAQTAPTLQWEKKYGNRRGPEQAFTISVDNPKWVVIGGTTYTPQPGGSSTANRRYTLWFFNQRGDSLRTVFPVSNVRTDTIAVTAVTPLPGGDLLLAGAGYDGRQTTQAGKLATGFMFLARTDSLTTGIRWMQRYNVGLSSSPSAPPVLLPDGGALLLFGQSVGTTPFNQVPYSHVGRVDSLGNMLWQHRYGAGYSGWHKAVACPDGSYAIVGYQNRLVTPTRLILNAWMLRLKADGDTLYNRYWGSATDLRYFWDVKNTPGGGLLLAGTHAVRPLGTVGSVGSGWLHQIDAHGNTQWDYDIVAANTNDAPRGADMQWLYVLQNGDFLLHGFRDQGYTPPTSTLGYLARWRPSTVGNTAPTPLWELQLPGISPTATCYAAASPDGSITLASIWKAPDPLYPQSTYDHVWLRHYASQGLPYQADLCATPPVANAAATRNPAFPDSLAVLDLGDAGPPYAQLLRWRWTFGDGTAAERLTQGVVRHRYATPPGPNTPVTVTVTNNLGCSASQTLYPFAPTATRAAGALAAGARVWPNPASGHVSVRLPGLRVQGPVAGEALDALGRVVARFALPLHAGVAEQTLDVSGWPAGVYTLRLVAEEGVVTKRLVRQ